MLMKLIQEMLTTMETYLENVGNDTSQTAAVTDTTSTATSDNTTDDASAALANSSGPVSNAQVESFLSQVEDQPNITADQKKQVDGMMAQYKNVPTTSAMLESIQSTLASSGILPLA